MLLPAKTATGDATVLSARSAWTAVATTSVAVAVLSPAKESLVALTVTVSVITVPLAVPAFTLYTRVKVPLAPAATLGLMHCGGKPAQLQPAGGVMETNVVFAGVASVNVAAEAGIAPVFVTT